MRSRESAEASQGRRMDQSTVDTKNVGSAWGGGQCYNSKIFLP
jgi:hypothetical protein